MNQLPVKRVRLFNNEDREITVIGSLKTPLDLPAPDGSHYELLLVRVDQAQTERPSNSYLEVTLFLLRNRWTRTYKKFRSCFGCAFKGVIGSSEMGRVDKAEA